MRPTAQQSIEASLTARVSDIEQALRERTALDLALERLGYMIDGNPTDAYVEVWELDELRSDVLAKRDGES